MKVHNGDDVDALRFDAIQEAVRELRKTPESATKRRARQWEVG
jgi:hypothetical protein